ncbi:putative hTH-type transcriptional repressor cytR [Candidatus Erwinia dacicola]|uniref:HTH-type transcriptional repressor cytR n=1 Tax=Candidatus Erwinia dacicola TaxID=252393 RepID=A0A328TP25_9GAMM|nr:putative hTH-type transcriptional repressor cytR [Candidatus Erwinia dacicola]
MPRSLSEIIRGIKVVAASEGYLVLIGDCVHQNQQEKSFLNLMLTRQIDGMVLRCSSVPFETGVEEQRNLPPVAMTNEFAPELELRTVYVDNLAASPALPDRMICCCASIACRATSRRCAVTASRLIRNISCAVNLVSMLVHRR